MVLEAGEALELLVIVIGDGPRDTSFTSPALRGVHIPGREGRHGRGWGSGRGGGHEQGGGNGRALRLSPPRARCLATGGSAERLREIQERWARERERARERRERDGKKGSWVLGGYVCQRLAECAREIRKRKGTRGDQRRWRHVGGVGSFAHTSVQIGCIKLVKCWCQWTERNRSHAERPTTVDELQYTARHHDIMFPNGRL